MFNQCNLVMKPFPSIFNDVIGPVMRGPSSSHTAASWRVGKMAIEILNDELKYALIELDKDGAWATNYEDQGTVLGMNGGLLGIDMADNAMKNLPTIQKKKDIIIDYQINSFENFHANSLQVTLEGHNGKSITILAASLGGGAFEIQKIDRHPVKINGDSYACFIWTNKDIADELQTLLPEDTRLHTSSKQNKNLYTLETAIAFDKSLVEHIEQFTEVEKIAQVAPVMPIISGREQSLPFDSVASLVQYSKQQNKSLGELGLMYEQYRSGLTETELKNKMIALIDIIEGSIQIGLAGTQHEDRILHQQSDLVAKAERAGKILQGSIINTIVQNVAAIMESKSALEVIVANPTAGSCGTVGAVMTAVVEQVNATTEEKIMAYFATGLIGAYFAMGPGFSAEEHGCQVECGASAGMAAAGIVEFFGGSAEQALGAASMAIQNMIGLVCDPIADRVEAPCLGKNTSAAVNALSSATMAVAGFNYLIPLDQVLETVQRVSNQMPTCVKCTGLGGLAITPAALALKDQLGK